MVQRALGAVGPDHWHVAANVPDAMAYRVLAQDRVWNCFAIADLAPPLRAYSQYAAASRGDTPPSAVCLVFRHPAFTMLIPSGDASGVAAIFAALDLPEVTEFQVQESHLSALEAQYQVLPGRREMLRMAVTPATFQPPTSAGAGATQLTLDDLPALLELYRRYPEGHFRPEQLQHGVFYGVRDGGKLVAAGGTHVVAEQYGLGVLGSIFTHPDPRRRGYGRAVTAAIVQELFERGCRDAMLTVFADNAPAQQLYTSLGFAARCRYWAGRAVRRTEPVATGAASGL